MMQFIPNKPTVTPARVIYFEDSRALDIAGRGTEKSEARLKSDVTAQLIRLGAENVVVADGQYNAPGFPSRTGYRFQFQFAGHVGRIDCAALPVRSPTDAKCSQAMRQALYLLADSLAAQYAAQFYQPGNYPLLPFLIGEGGRTVSEAMLDSGILPLLTAGERR